MSRVPIAKLVEWGYAWPPNRRVPITGEVDLPALVAFLERDLASHERDRADMYAFAEKWQAPIEETTDRLDEVLDAIEECRAALEVVRKIAHRCWFELTDGRGIGHTVGRRYRLDRLLGQATVGPVYAAQDLEAGTQVAVRVLLGLDPTALAQFRALAPQVIAPTPGTIATLAWRAEDGEPYVLVVTELVEPYQRVADLGKLSPAHAVAIARAVLEALDATPLVHGGLRPSKLVVRPDGRIALSDLALALARYDPLSTRAGGPPAIQVAMYMAPEVVRGEPIDRRTDIYGVGACLYAMLCGRDPYPRSEVAIQVLAAVVMQDPPPLDAPPALVAVVSRAMHKDPAQRYQTPGAMIAALEAGG